ncbi:MAG: 2-succinyl-5-enolpyruvyl-6-hydroxy-3-cyclohexene-1-carboxylic-acid synthase [Bacteroidetes bacterium]|nr:2-succinyl-5-enolpyruvyl-6-hydroxy-3-cyclohexene-1-carboxylic-acid synthase [Bacteroidota bacterium]
MPLLEPVFRISEICSLKGIEDVIICPGSRSAAITLAFNRNPEIRTKVIADERSAAFYGLGMALETGKTVALVCTSGSAALNFAPAVSEAFFQEIPMLVLTADRPPEWIHQYDGQTIFQKDIYGKHVKKAFELPVDYSHPDARWQIERIFNEAIDLSQAAPKGPVHINVPIREPFYPEDYEEYEFGSNKKHIRRVAHQAIINPEDWADLLEIWRNADGIMVAVGQNSQDLEEELSELSEGQNVVVVADVIANIQVPEVIRCHDLFLPKISEPTFNPDLLLTFGKSFISKSLKQFLRKHKPKYHFHIQENPELIDPLQSMTHKIEVNAKYFLKEVAETLDFEKFKEGEEDTEESDFKLNWQNAELSARKYIHRSVFVEDFAEIQATAMIFDALPEYSGLHLGNSMPVRYANYLSVLLDKNQKVSCNRGTSGIDGIVSTALGQAAKYEGIYTCILGDVSFFYDSNALYINGLSANFRCVVINNGGGNIFRLIDGPSKQPELEEFFVTSQKRNAGSICAETGIKYFRASNQLELSEILKVFFEKSDTPKLLEVFTDGETDATIFKSFKSEFTL